jgi:predicted HTH domain antitoxin
MQVTVNIPDEFASLVLPQGLDEARLLLEAAVASAYREGRLSTDQVRRILGFATRFEVDPFLRKHEIFDYSVDDLEQDMAGLDELLGARPARKSA